MSLHMVAAIICSVLAMILGAMLYSMLPIRYKLKDNDLVVAIVEVEHEGEAGTLGVLYDSRETLLFTNLIKRITRAGVRIKVVRIERVLEVI